MQKYREKMNLQSLFRLILNKKYKQLILNSGSLKKVCLSKLLIPINSRF